jgi:hypothetical protein
MPLYVRAVITVVNGIFMFSDTTILYYTMYVIFTWLGNFASPFFFAYHLLDLVYRSETLRVRLAALPLLGRRAAVPVCGVLVAVVSLLSVCASLLTVYLKLLQTACHSHDVGGFDALRLLAAPMFLAVSRRTCWRVSRTTAVSWS